MEELVPDTDPSGAKPEGYFCEECDHHVCRCNMEVYEYCEKCNVGDDCDDCDRGLKLLESLP